MAFPNTPGTPSFIVYLFRKTPFKQLIVCIQFRPDYPASPLFVELKSKTLSTKLLDGLADVCEKECKALLNKAQVLDLPFNNFCHGQDLFRDDNPMRCLQLVASRYCRF